MAQIRILPIPFLLHERQSHSQLLQTVGNFDGNMAEDTNWWDFRVS